MTEKNMELTEAEKLNIERDIKCNSNKINELRQDFRTREPAKETNKMITNMTLEMAIFKEELKGLAKDNAEQHKEILQRVCRIEQFILGILILFALSALYFIFAKVGLSN